MMRTPACIIFRGQSLAFAGERCSSRVAESTSAKKNFAAFPQHADARCHAKQCLSLPFSQATAPPQARDEYRVRRCAFPLPSSSTRSERELAGNTTPTDPRLAAHPRRMYAGWKPCGAPALSSALMPPIGSSPRILSNALLSTTRSDGAHCPSGLSAFDLEAQIMSDGAT
jgi:hypothetical protein